MKYPKTLQALLIVAVGVGLIAAGTALAADQPKFGGSIRFALEGQPPPSTPT